MIEVMYPAFYTNKMKHLCSWRRKDTQEPYYLAAPQSTTPIPAYSLNLFLEDMIICSNKELPKQLRFPLMMPLLLLPCCCQLSRYFRKVIRATA
jgi:hypothetical protein